MAREDAIHALDDPENLQINWAIGDLLRLRAARADWLECRLLQQLEAGAVENLNAWRGLIRDTRRSLAAEADLPQKARLLLRPESASFDQSLDDFIAEMVAAIYLSRLGHTGIRFPSEQDEITTDLISVHDGTTCVTEAKNLREPNSLAYVAFACWYQDRAAHPQRYDFTVELLKIDDPFDDLTAQQAGAVCHMIDELPNRARPSVFHITLPGNRNLQVRIADGTGGLLHHGGGPFLVRPVVEECQRAVLLKLLEPTRKALTQLYSSAIPPEYRKLLFFRWKPPDNIAAIAEAGPVRDFVRDRCEAFIREFFPNFRLAIGHTIETIEDIPPVIW